MPAIGSVTALAVAPDFAGVDRKQTVDAAQQRGLAAARRADDGDDLALAESKSMPRNTSSAP